MLSKESYYISSRIFLLQLSVSVSVIHSAKEKFYTIKTLRNYELMKNLVYNID